MASVSLEFQGVQDASLPLTLVAVVGVLLAGWGVVQLVRRRVRYGLVCLAAALGPAAFVPAMAIDAGLRYARGNRRGGGSSLLAAAAATAGAAAGGLLVAQQVRAVWMVALALQIAIAVGVFYSTVYGYLGRLRLLTLMALRCAGILALMAVLFKPALSVAPEGAGDRAFLPVLVDRSASMATADEVNLPDRYHQCIEALRAQESRVEKHFRPLWYQFASSARPAESLGALSEMSAAGEGTDGTDLAGAIRSAAADRPRAALAGIVVLTDGIHNASGAVGDAAVEAGVPVYLVGVGSADERAAARRNVQVLTVDAPLEAVVNNVTAMTVRAKLAGFATAPMEVQLLEEAAAAPADTQRLWTDQNVATLTAQLKWTPREIAAAGGATRPAAEAVRRLKVLIPPNPAEADAEDNSFELHVLLTEPRIRVLYVEGTIRPEYKFLSRLLKSDPNIRFVALVRMEGNRFWSQGDVAGRKLDRLPETDADYAMFDVIVIGDLDRTYLSKEQLSRLRKFVTDGGGLLMLGGHSSFGPGGYGGTDLEAVLPVLCGTRNQPQELTPFVPQLTAVGELHPIFEGLKGYFYGPGGRKPDETAAKLPNLLGCVTVAALKSGAQLLAMHPTRTAASVVLAVQNVGAGRSAAFTADTTWKWYLPMHGMGADSPYERFWGQMFRWLANVTTKARESKPSVVLRLDRTHVRVGDEPVKVLCRVQDEKGRPADNAQVSCQITPAAGGQGETTPLSPRMGDRLFEGEYRPVREGKYRVVAGAKDAAGTALGGDELTLTVAPFSKETDRLARNDVLMQLIADRSGGRAVDIAALPDLIDQVVRRQEARGRPNAADEARIVTLYNFTLLFLAFVVLLTAEWLLRRQWHLR